MTQTRTRRPSPHCKLASLPPEKKEQVISWLLDEGLPYDQAAARAKEVFGFDVNPATFSRFWHQECVPRKLQRASIAATAVQALAGTLGMEWQEANAQLLGQRVFETLASKEVDLKTVAALGNALEKVKTRAFSEKKLKAQLAAEKRREARHERQLALAREKFEFDAVDAALGHAPAIRTITADRALSSDEKREQVRRLLFPQAFDAVPA